MPQFDPYTSSSIESDHKNKVENATTKPAPPATLHKPAQPAEQLSECDLCECCRAHTTSTSHPQRPSTCASPTSGCCGTSCPDLDTASADSTSPFHSPATFHQRHAHLRLQQQQKTLVGSNGESFSGTRLSPADLPELQRSQQEDDSIRMMLAGERADAEGVNGDEPVPGEFSKEIKMLNGGWMDRSKMC